MAALPLAPAPVYADIHLREPHAKQRLFLESTAKRKIIRAGRRGGKTTGIAILAVEMFAKGRRVLYAAPTADQLSAFWREVKKAVQEPLDAGVYTKNETEHTIDIAPHTRHVVVGQQEIPDRMRQRIRAKTAWNAETLRGDYADVLILDEFQLMNEDTWEVVGAPMLLDNNGDAVFIYTPPSLRTAGVTKANDPRHASKLYKRAAADTTGRWLAVHFTSHDNPHISATALQEITQDMTALSYRQEIEAEDVDEVPGALWTRKLLEETRIPEGTQLAFKRIVVGVDPSGSSTTEAGIVAAGIAEIAKQDHLVIIADRSLAAPSPKAWASAAVSLYDELHADRICGERNYGGDMVEMTVRTVNENVSYKDVNATRGKLVRAEPIAALFEKGRAHILGKLALLEDELCSYVPGNDSPNRMDGMVWAATELTRGGSLGLVEFFKQGAAQKLYELTVAGPPVAAAKEIAAAPLERCPACNCVTVQVIAGGQKRCQECGTQFGAGKTNVWQPGRREFNGVGHVGRH